MKKKKENKEYNGGDCPKCGTHLSFSTIDKRDDGSIWTGKRWCSKCKNWHVPVQITK